IYRENLQDLPGLEFQPESPWGRHARWLTCITVDPAQSGVHRDDLLNALEAENIEARPVWKPLHMQPLFAGCEVVGGEVAERLFERGLCLPSGSNLSDADLERVIAVIRGTFEGVRRPSWVDTSTPASSVLVPA
ncbi:MAG TPA: DegT/DnrJ/EryC1/StrS family aminotransferase, partial [Longimicrobiales bacterium]|nr:DegT/DnrJ/EryC1/StrS family aminotransferase [Longimicrobiales bacterium]